MREIASYSEYNISTVQTCRCASRVIFYLLVLCFGQFTICRDRGLGVCLVRKLLPNTHLPYLEATRVVNEKMIGCEVAFELGSTRALPSDISVQN
jgi:hypothetical protein